MNKYQKKNMKNYKKIQKQLGLSTKAAKALSDMGYIAFSMGEEEFLEMLCRLEDYLEYVVNGDMPEETFNRIREEQLDDLQFLEGKVREIEVFVENLNLIHLYPTQGDILRAFKKRYLLLECRYFENTFIKADFRVIDKENLEIEFYSLSYTKLKGDECLNGYK